MKALSPSKTIQPTAPSIIPGSTNSSTRKNSKVCGTPKDRGSHPNSPRQSPKSNVSPLISAPTCTLPSRNRKRINRKWSCPTVLWSRKRASWETISQLSETRGASCRWHRMGRARRSEWMWSWASILGAVAAARDRRAGLWTKLFLHFGTLRSWSQIHNFDIYWESLSKHSFLFNTWFD